jgi:hypothetical protein
VLTIALRIRESTVPSTIVSIDHATSWATGSANTTTSRPPQATVASQPRPPRRRRGWTASPLPSAWW